MNSEGAQQPANVFLPALLGLGAWGHGSSQGVVMVLFVGWPSINKSAQATHSFEELDSALQDHGEDFGSLPQGTAANYLKIKCTTRRKIRSNWVIKLLETKLEYHSWH